jgi:hypothetical protein
LKQGIHTNVGHFFLQAICSHDIRTHIFGYRFPFFIGFDKDVSLNKWPYRAGETDIWIIFKVVVELIKASGFNSEINLK